MAVVWEHACLLVVGHLSGTPRRGAALLLQRRGQRRQLMCPGGLRDRRDVDGCATAFREFAEEVLGLKSSAAVTRGAELRAAARSLRGPYGSGRHQAFLCSADELFGSIEAAQAAFRANREASTAVLVALDGLDGGATRVTDVGGAAHDLRNHLGVRRVNDAHAMLRSLEAKRLGPGRRLGAGGVAAGPDDEPSGFNRVLRALRDMRERHRRFAPY